MDHPFNADTSLNASTSHDGLTNTVRINVHGNLSQASRPSLVHMIHDLRSRGVQSHVNVDLSRASLVESAALAGLRQDLNAMEGAAGTAGGGVSLVLTMDEAAWQSGDSEEASQPSLVALPGRPLEEYSDDELFAASDTVFSLLDDPGTVRGSDLLGRYNDIGQEIVRRTPLSELLDPSLVNPPAENQSVS